MFELIFVCVIFSIEIFVLIYAYLSDKCEAKFGVQSKNVFVTTFLLIRKRVRTSLFHKKLSIA